MRSRRIRRHAAALDVTAFINLIVVLVPFLLSTAVFTRLAVIELSLPAPAASTGAPLPIQALQLEIALQPEALVVSDRVGGLIQRIPHTAGAHGGPDLATLARLMRQLKIQFPAATSATVRAQPETAYDTLIQVMDAVREVPATHGPRIRTAPVPLFPDISIGDAPGLAGEPTATP